MLHVPLYAGYVLLRYAMFAVRHAAEKAINNAQLIVASA